MVNHGVLKLLDISIYLIVCRLYLFSDNKFKLTVSPIGLICILCFFFNRECGLHCSCAANFHS